MTASVAEPDILSERGSLRIYFSIRMKSPKGTDKRVMIIPKYPAIFKGKRLKDTILLTARRRSLKVLYLALPPALFPASK